MRPRPDLAAKPPGRLELERVVKHYHRASEDIRAVDDVSLVVEPGEMVTIRGPSGSGKSTLLYLMAAIMPPDAGTVRYAGRDLASLSDAQASNYLLQDVGFIWQNFNLTPGASALENAAMKLQFGGIAKVEAFERATPWLERVGLGDRLDDLPSALSTGQCQRVAIAGALAGEPRLILADEPTGNLDSEQSEKIGQLLRSIAHEQGAAVILVTHDQEVARISDHHYTLRDGKLIADGASGISPVPALPSPGRQPESP